MDNLQNKIHWILQEKYSGKLTFAAKKDIQKLKMGEPLDYIIGFTEFLGCKIDLSKRPLIPRVETEFWVEKAIEQVSPFTHGRGKKGIKVLDMFSGSGCIGIAVLKHVKNSRVVFADLEKNTLKQIKINAKMNKIPSSRYKVIQSDIFSSLDGKYDYIFANPPYIAKNRKHKVQQSVLKYEPRAALFGGNDGLFYIKKFLTEAKNFLNPSTSSGQVPKVFMEFDSIQKRHIETFIKKCGYKKCEFRKDQYSKWRYVVIQHT